MAKATKKSSTNAITAHPACPVVDLSRHLMDLWDAADASEREFNKDKALDLIGESVKEQIDDWQSALVSIISFTEAKSPAGALVQMALALDVGFAVECRRRPGRGTPSARTPRR
jgi:hypothetical protein